MQKSNQQSFCGFPYPNPYSVQNDFMKSLLDFLDQDKTKLGLFESPTGTVSNKIIILSIIKL